MMTSTSNTHFLSQQNFPIAYLCSSEQISFCVSGTCSYWHSFPKCCLGCEHTHFNQTSQDSQAGWIFWNTKIPPRTAKIKSSPLEELLPLKHISKIHPRIFISFFSLSKNTRNIKITGRREVGGRMCQSWFYSPGWLWNLVIKKKNYSWIIKAIMK